jgi:hypothetical protein
MLSAPPGRLAPRPGAQPGAPRPQGPLRSAPTAPGPCGCAPAAAPGAPRAQQRARAGGRCAAARDGPRGAAVTLGAVYALLGLPNGAPYTDVRSAYRRMAAESHPDVDPSPNASSKFKVGRGGGAGREGGSSRGAEAEGAPAQKAAAAMGAAAAARPGLPPPPCPKPLPPPPTPHPPPQAVNLAVEVLTDASLRSLAASRGVGALGPKYSYLREYLIGHGLAGGGRSGRSGGSAGGANPRRGGGPRYAPSGFTAYGTSASFARELTALGCEKGRRQLGEGGVPRSRVLSACSCRSAPLRRRRRPSPLSPLRLPSSPPPRRRAAPRRRQARDRAAPRRRRLHGRGHRVRRGDDGHGARAVAESLGHLPGLPGGRGAAGRGFSTEERGVREGVCGRSGRDLRNLARAG